MNDDPSTPNVPRNGAGPRETQNSSDRPMPCEPGESTECGDAGSIESNTRDAALADSRPIVVATPRRRPFSIETPPQRSSTSPPKLGIAHLMLWTAATAIYLALNRRPAGFEGLSAVLATLLHGGVVGIAWAGSSVLVVRVVLRRPRPIEPGLWLLLTIGLDWFVRVACDGPIVQMRNVGILALSARALALTLSTFHRSRELHWSVASICAAFIFLMPAILSFLMSLADFGPVEAHISNLLLVPRRITLAADVVLLVAVKLDGAKWRRDVSPLGDARRTAREPSTRRTWIHWLGLTIYFGSDLARSILFAIGK